MSINLFVERSAISPGAAVIAMSLPDEVFTVPTVIGIGGAAEMVTPQKDVLVRSIADLIREHLAT